jgi:hypothetical protein
LENEFKEYVDPLFRNQQAGFRKGKSCTYQIATFRIILEQSREWNTPLYISFIDCEKAFENLDMQTLWKLLGLCGVPAKFVDLIRNQYEEMTCRVVQGGYLTKPFNVLTGVRQGCLLPPFLFLLAIDWFMKTSSEGKRSGIQWTLMEQLDDCASDLASPSS